MTPRPIVPNPDRPAPTQPRPGTPSPMHPPQGPPTRPRIGFAVLLATPPTQPKPHPADPNKPWPGPNPGPNVWAMARPDDMPVPTTPAPPPPPTPKPGISLRIGHAPRLPRRERTVRLLTQLGRYALAFAVVTAVYVVGSTALAVFV